MHRASGRGPFRDVVVCSFPVSSADRGPVYGPVVEHASHTVEHCKGETIRQSHEVEDTHDRSYGRQHTSNGHNAGRQ